MKAGDRVKVKYTDALGHKMSWEGNLRDEVPNGWRVDLGGIAIVFNTEDIVELKNGEEIKGDVGQTETRNS